MFAWLPNLQLWLPFINLEKTVVSLTLFSNLTSIDPVLKRCISADGDEVPIPKLGVPVPTPIKLSSSAAALSLITSAEEAFLKAIDGLPFVSMSM